MEHTGRDTGSGEGGRKSGGNCHGGKWKCESGKQLESSSFHCHTLIT